jgi:hypothetical protein
VNLLEVFQALCDRQLIPQSRQKDFKTAIRYLSDALGTPSEAITDLEQVEVTYKEVLRDYFQRHPKGPSTIRNTQNFLSRLFREATTAKLLHVREVAPHPARHRGKTTKEILKEAIKTSPYRNRVGHHLGPYKVPLAQWPEDIQTHWITYRARRSLDIRTVTLDRYESQLASLISYGLKYDHPPIASWDDLFNIERFTRFSAWQSKRVGVKRITVWAYHIAGVLTALAAHTQRPEFFEWRQLMKRLPHPTPMHNKQALVHSFDHAELEAIALQMLAEARKPVQFRHNAKGQLGIHRSCRHRTALILRLLWRTGLRSRNIREMELNKQLYRNESGKWQLRFIGDDLKVGERRGKVNTLCLPWPEELTEHLEEYLREHRPRFPNADRDPHVFLTRRGRPLDKDDIRQQLFLQVLTHTPEKKRFFPHMARTLWTDTWLEHHGDIDTAAALLNDTPQTIMKHYHELRTQEHIEKALAFNRQTLGQPPRTSHP